MIGRAGELLGIGSLQVQQVRESGTPEPLNMIVPIDILKPILDDMRRLEGDLGLNPVDRARVRLTKEEEGSPLDRWQRDRARAQAATA